VRLRQILRKIRTFVVVVAASIYFLIDALFLSILRPLAKGLAKLPVFAALASWIAARSPYTTLALFLVPLILLEPIKPVSIYLIASGHSRYGLLVLAVGELLKILIVERIFHIGRDKLMTIPAFAWAYNFVMGWLEWLKALPPWQAVLRQYEKAVRRIRSLWLSLKMSLKKPRQSR
jgi:hypothetical protein